MATNTKWYVGRNGGSATAFKSATAPTIESHGHLYKSVTGPFRTKRGAMFDAAMGLNNPHVQHVNDAERIAKELAG